MNALELSTLELEMLTQRSVCAGDTAFLRCLYAAERAEELALFPWTDAQKEAFLSQQFAARQAHYALAFPNTLHSLLLLECTPIGVYSVLRGTGELHLLLISLLPNCRNRGLGTALLQELMGEAVAAGVPLRLQVEVHNPAFHLYTRLGFQSVSTDGVYAVLEYVPSCLSSS